MLKPTFEVLLSMASIFLGSGAVLVSPFGESSASLVLVTNFLPFALHLAFAGAANIWTTAPSLGCILAKAEVT